MSLNILSRYPCRQLSKTLPLCLPALSRVDRARSRVYTRHYSEAPNPSAAPKVSTATTEDTQAAEGVVKCVTIYCWESYSRTQPPNELPDIERTVHKIQKYAFNPRPQEYSPQFFLSTSWAVKMRRIDPDTHSSYVIVMTPHANNRSDWIPYFLKERQLGKESELKEKGFTLMKDVKGNYCAVGTLNVRWLGGRVVVCEISNT